MFNWLRKFMGRPMKAKEDWKLVHTFKENVNVTTNSVTTAEKGFVYYHLFESNEGNRRVEFSSTIQMASQLHLEENMKRLSTYIESIYPWLQGRYHPDVPNYNDVPGLDIINKLSKP